MWTVPVRSRATERRFSRRQLPVSIFPIRQRSFAPVVGDRPTHERGAGTPPLARGPRASRVVGTALASLALSVGMVAVTATASGAAGARSRVAPPVGTQVAELEGSDTVGYNYLGVSAAVSGSTAIVGAEGYASNTGRAYVFTDAGGAWKQVAELKGTGTVAGDIFGNSVAISGSTAIVGAP